MPNGVTVKNGLDVQKGSHHRRGGGNPSAALEEKQVVDREPVTHLGGVFLGKALGLFQIPALQPFFRRQGHQQAKAQRGAKRIHCLNSPLGILFPQLPGGDHAVLVGGA